MTDLNTLLPEFVRIPAVPFLMGTPEEQLSSLAKHYGGTRESYREESPQHTVSLPAYALARTPVTNALYARYVQATGARAPLPWHAEQPPAEMYDLPVVDISWAEVQAFCSWLTDTWQGSVMVVGSGSENGSAAVEAPRFRLPSEAEWEHAARGTDGRLFPWGADEEPFDLARANVKESGRASPTPVGSYPAGASPYGLLDMAGNVWELTATLDALYPYDPQRGLEDPQASGRRIARGGCYANPHGFARCACRFRFAPEMRNPFLGFRLAL